MQTPWCERHPHQTHIQPIWLPRQLKSPCWSSKRKPLPLASQLRSLLWQVGDVVVAGQAALPLFKATRPLLAVYVWCQARLRDEDSVTLKLYRFYRCVLGGLAGA